MQAAPARYVSVSELYTTDEVELLLEEIRDLEPTSCRGEDVQDFEIAGSGFGWSAGGGAGGGGGGGGGRSPCGTELTERSWDSHAHYSRAPPPSPRPIAPCYCRLAHLLTLHGALSALIVACSLCACACVWTVCGVRVRRLPLSWRVQLLALGALSSALAHSALLLLHVGGLGGLMPLPWAHLHLWLSVWSAVSLLVGALSSLHAVLLAADYRWAQPLQRGLLLAAAGLGLVAGSMALVIVCVRGVACWAARGRGAAGEGARGAGGTYRAVPPAPPPAAPQPSTSQDHTL